MSLILFTERQEVEHIPEERLLYLLDLGEAWCAAEEERPRTALETFSLEEPESPHGETVLNALIAIDEIHYYSGCPRLPIRFAAARHDSGRLCIAGTIPYRILLSPRDEVLGIAALHEMGHFLDHQGFGAPGEFSSVFDTRFNPWWEAIQQSQAYKTLEAELPRLVATGEISEDWCGYLSAPEELWARSYAQFIAVESGDPALLAELRLLRQRRHNMHLPEQWEDDDFAAIDATLGELFCSGAVDTANELVLTLEI